MMKKVFFFGEKTFSSFEIASLPNWVNANYAGDSQPSCYSCNEGVFEKACILSKIHKSHFKRFSPIRKKVMKEIQY